MERTLEEYLQLDLKNNHFRYMPEVVKAELVARTFACTGSSLDERAYWLQHGLKGYPNCQRCGASLSSKNWYPSANKTQKARGWPNKGYRPFCSKTCAMNSEAKHSRTAQSSIDRYGVPHASQSDEFQARRKLTNLERYGATNPMAWNSDRFRDSIMELHGVDAVRHIPGVADKIRETKAALTLGVMRERVPELERLFEVSLLSELPTRVERIDDVELRWKHSCGHIYASNITQRGLRFCPRCSHGSSRAERSLGDWLEELGVKVQRRDRTFGFELDLYLPEHQIAIEYDGTYWHSARFVSREKSLEKLESCSRIGIQLVTIQEHLWINCEPKVRARLRALLGLNERLAARKCHVKEITVREANEFLGVAHLQGGAKAKVAVGLFHQTELMAVMTFGPPRFSTAADWELIRYASKPGISIQGGAARLLTAFRKAHIGSILSYADRCWSIGVMYQRLGFEFLRNSPPSYFWVSGQRIFTRYQTQKKKLPKLLGDLGREFDKAFSEADNMRAAKFLQVFDRGNSVWLLRAAA